MYLLVMRKPRFSRSLVGRVSATACLTLLGCGGSNAPSPPAMEAPASAGAGGLTAAAAGSTTTQHSSPGAGGVAGFVNVGPVGHGGNVSPPDASGSGGLTGGSAGTTGGGIDFSHGSHLLIPQRALTAVHLGPNGDYRSIAGSNATLANADVTLDTNFMDAPIYSRQFEVTFGMAGLFLTDCQIWTGKFVAATVDVKQDVGGSGAHLKIEQVDGHYMLTHDGPGKHQIRVTGTFQADRTPDTGGSCPTLPMGAVTVPLAFTTNIDIQRMASVAATPPLGCAAGSAMLSGRNYPGTRIGLLNEQGQAVYASNVYDSYPLDVLVETEKPAQIAETGSGLHYDGLIVTGEPQTVRLSTSYGTLFTYQLANTAMIDGWDVKYWAQPTQYIKSARTAFSTDTTPATAAAKVLGATATLQIGGIPLCSPILPSDFAISFLTPDVCKVQYEDSPNPNPGIPGFLATFVDPAGTCELELSVPGSNGGKPLFRHLSAILQPTN